MHCLHSLHPGCTGSGAACDCSIGCFLSMSTCWNVISWELIMLVADVAAALDCHRQSYSASQMLLRAHPLQEEWPALTRHVCSQIGQYDRALEDYTAALDADPSSSYALYNRGILNDRLGYYAAAIKDFSAAIELEPGNSDFFHNRGYALRKLVGAGSTLLRK